MEKIKEKEIRLIKPEEIRVKDSGRPDKMDYCKLAKERGLISTSGEFFLLGGFVTLVLPGLYVYCFFTSKEAAENYFELFYKNSMYPVYICKKIKQGIKNI